MKKVLFSFLFIGLAAGLYAQSGAFEKGDKVVNAGIGIGSTLYSGSGYSMSIPPVFISGEYGLLDDILDKGSIGVGGYLGFAKNKWEYFNYGWKYTNIIVGARGSFHYPFIDKLDTYAGVMIGFNIVSSTSFGSSGSSFFTGAESSKPIFALYAGGRYYFTDNLSVIAEIGYGIAYLTVGVGLRID
ncbi:hypothetical protein ACFLSI_03880 [Bacteroidota bacterium]